MIQFALSLAGIALIVALAWGLGFRTAPLLADEAEAARITRDALPGFTPARVSLDVAGKGALLEDAAGRIILVRAMGDRWVVRALDHPRATIDGSRLTLRPREPAFGPATLDLGAEAPHWAGRFA